MCHHQKCSLPPFKSPVNPFFMIEFLMDILRYHLEFLSLNIMFNLEMSEVKLYIVFK